MSAIELIGAIAASCSAKAASTSSVVRRPTQSWMIGVELVSVLDPARVVAKPGLLDQVLPADDLHHPLGDRLGARGEPEPATVLRLVGVARGGERCGVARSLLDDPELVVDEGLGAEDPEERLVDREVDHLAAPRAAVLAPPEGEHGCEGPVSEATASASAKGGSVGGPSGQPLMYA